MGTEAALRQPASRAQRMYTVLVLSGSVRAKALRQRRSHFCASDFEIAQYATCNVHTFLHAGIPHNFDFMFNFHCPCSALYKVSSSALLHTYWGFCGEATHSHNFTQWIAHGSRCPNSHKVW